MVDVPIMGSFAGSELRSSVLNLTAGYCEPGDIPSIKVHRTNGEIVDMFVTAVEGSLGFREWVTQLLLYLMLISRRKFHCIMLIQIHLILQL